MSTRFRNFMAANRRPNMHAFGLFPTVDDLTWIEAYQLTPTAGTVSGTVNGVNATFTVAEKPTDVRIWVNGVKQIETTDYSYVSTTGTITFTVASVPGYGAIIEVDCIGD